MCHVVHSLVRFTCTIYANSHSRYVLQLRRASPLLCVRDGRILVIGISLLPARKKIPELTVHSRILELPCWNTIFKQQINLSKGAILGLREPEPAPNVAKEIGSSIKEARFGAPIPIYSMRYVSPVSCD